MTTRQVGNLLGSFAVVIVVTLCVMVLTPWGAKLHFLNNLIGMRVAALAAIIASAIAFKAASRWWAIILLASIAMLFLAVIELS